jgi:hypothetical protein
MPVSREHEQTPNEGIIIELFAYLVDGASFWNQQSEAFNVVYREAKHYRFFTGF